MKNCEAICGIYGIYFRQDQKNDDKIAKIGNAMFDEPFASGSVVDSTKKQQLKVGISGISGIHLSVCYYKENFIFFTIIFSSFF